MNTKKRVAKNIFMVASSRLVSLLSGVAVGFLIPKILTVEGYGYMKIFTLYSVYTSLLHLGFVDGILLKYAGCDYDKFDKNKFCTLSRFYIFFQCIIGSIMILVSFFLTNSDYSFILLMLGVFTVATNVTTYYQFVSQAVGRFSEYSARDFYASLLKLIFVGVLFFLHMFKVCNVTYQAYLIGLNAITVVLLLWYIYSYRDITFKSGIGLSTLKNEITAIFKAGIILTVAYQTSHLVYALDSQFVSMLYDTKTYAQYSFAYNITGLITTMVTSLSIVMFPMLKKVDKESAGRYFGKILSGLSVFSGLAIALYFPIVIFVGWYLEKYDPSLVYLRIVFPSIMLQLNIAVVLFTFAKVLDENTKYFYNSIIVLAVGFLTNLVAYLIFKTPESITYASFLTMLVWFLIEGRHISKIVGYRIKKVFAYLMLISAGFLTVTVLDLNIFLQILSYLVYYLIVTVVFYHKVLKSIKKTHKNA